MGSTRFRGKMMERLGRHRIIEWVLRRTLRATMLDQVVLATSTAVENDVLRDVAEQLSVAALSGSEDDVLSRFVSAADEYGADYVVRVCADNPFIAPEEIDRIARFYLDETPDYAFNHIPKIGNMYPDGLGAEILSSALLHRLGVSTTESRHREHATLYIWDHMDEFRIETIPAPREIAFPSVKLDVDTPADLERLRRIVDGLEIDSPAVDVVNSYRAIYGD
jgi:spore coat polysaccharide biosynthesis protein SpsF